MKHILVAIFTNMLILLNFSQSVLSAAEQKQDVSVQIIGSGGPHINDGKASISYLIWVDGKAKVMIDAGGGSSLNFERSGANFLDIDAMLFTHFHEDHAADFPVYVKAAVHLARKNTLTVFGPAGNDHMGSASEFVSTLFAQDKGLFRITTYGVKDSQGEARASIAFKINVTDVALDKDIIQYFKLSDSIKLSAIQTEHTPLPAIAWRVDIGDKSVAFSGDMTNYFNTLAKLAKDCDLLIAHNVNQEVPNDGFPRRLRVHMPPSEIGKIAAEANVKKLILSHRSARVEKLAPQSQEIIKKSYSGPIQIAEDLDEYPL